MLDNGGEVYPIYCLASTRDSGLLAPGTNTETSVGGLVTVYE